MGSTYSPAIHEVAHSTMEYYRDTSLYYYWMRESSKLYCMKNAIFNAILSADKNNLSARHRHIPAAPYF